jgi:Oxidoreductase molybdopterin binding domain
MKKRPCGETRRSASTRDRPRQNRLDVPRPSTEREASLHLVGMAVIDRRHAANYAAPVIKHRLDHMRRDPRPRHTGGRRHTCRRGPRGPSAEPPQLHGCPRSLPSWSILSRARDRIDAFHPQTILAHSLNDVPLPVVHGAPLRLRVERQHGYKHAKYVMRIDMTDRLDGFGRGKGGFWEDRGYEWYAGI